MKFSDAGLVENVVYNMRLADLPRGSNRARLNELADGFPPYTPEEKRDGNINTNVNFLEFPELLADARRSYYNAFLKPGNFFTVTLDRGSPVKRLKDGKAITREINRVMKGSRSYFEFNRSQFAQAVEHGIGPGFWRDREHWCPKPVGIEDVLIPSDTLLDMSNCSYFAVFRQYTAMELYMATHGVNVDPAWNMDVVKAALVWADQQWWKEQSYTDLYAPEKVESRMKQDLGFYGTDSIPTIDAWDFYFWSDDGKKQGWRRRMVLDTPGTWEIGGKARIPRNKSMPKKNLIGGDHGKWLYNPGDDRVYAERMDQIIHFQFADASAVAPFKYHTVRSLGWLLYSVCHLQNRLRCKLNDALFESLLQYFRATNPEDHERVTKIDLHNYGIVPEGVTFVTQQERWKVDGGLAELGLTQNQARMQASAAQYREGRQTETDKREKTATQIMSEVNAANALVGALLIQAYQSKVWEYRECCRRFCQKNSTDPDVREFMKRVLAAGVKEETLDVSLWNIEPERVLGSGNKVLEVAMADKLMAARPLHDPDSQREILYLYDMANSDNPDLADRLVNMDKPKITESVHEAQLMVGTLMQGVTVQPAPGQNAAEIVPTLLEAAGEVMKGIQMTGKADLQQVRGIATIARTCGLYLDILGQDETQADLTKELGKKLAALMQALKALQGMVEKQAPQEQQAGQDPKDAAKAQAMVIQAKTKAALTAESHRQRTMQRDVQFQAKMAQDEQKHQAEMRQEARRQQMELAKASASTAMDLANNRLKALSE